MGRGASRTKVDSAGGTIIGTKAPTVFINGTPVAVIGDQVAGHAPGPHAGPVMATGSSNVFAHGIGCCREGDFATCGDRTSPNSSNVFIN